jgi:hypothetical protein
MIQHFMPRPARKLKAADEDVSPALVERPA